MKNIDKNSAIIIGTKKLTKLQKEWEITPLRCKELENKKVVINAKSRSNLNCSKEKNKNRIKKGKEPILPDDIIKRVKLIPYIEHIIKNGRRYDKYDKKEGYLLVGRAMINNKETGLEVKLVDKFDKNEKVKKLLYLHISTFDIDI